ncbi:MAG: DUF389 domain-containing protein [Bacteroidia bacterium]|nr:DUF389 domain-containing protein [Bacteroidia bacterium]
MIRFLKLLVQRALAPLQVVYRVLRLYRVFDITPGTDIEGTIRALQGGTVLKGSEMWILIAAALLASIGLDTNSPAVIIGAMLISPLMSPILGIGLGVGINHRQVLAKATRLFGLYIGVALLTATVYFLVSPLGDVTPEMTARTRPTLLDAGVAIFGGMAGIIAISRTEKSNAIPGVAIATALMPPLCTSAFGLATGRIGFFLGAFYLFFLNAVLIALATYLVVQVLRFPHVAYRDKAQTRRWNRAIAGLVVVVLIPAGVLFYDLIVEAGLRRRVERFIAEHIEVGDREVFNHEIVAHDSVRTLKVFVLGPPIPTDSIPRLTQLLPKYRLERYRLDLVQMDVPPDAQNRIRKEILDNVLQVLEINRRLEDERRAGEQAAAARYGGTLDFEQLQREVQIQYPEVASVAYARAYRSDLATARTTLDTLPVVVVTWQKGLKPAQKKALHQKLEDWLRVRVGYANLRLLEDTPE